jgi:SAM-dependent methyltransferase
MADTSIGAPGDRRRTHGLSFGQAAQEYDRARPRYPRDAVLWMLGPEPLRVVDLGAGTGIFTRQLLEAGHDVVAVEPDGGMRDALRATVQEPAAEVLDGSAERIPLPDASVDAVTAAQAYHWFDPGPAHAEIARVLRPGGVFAPVWNVRDDDVPWVRELALRTRSEENGTSSWHQAAALTGTDLGPAFGPLGTAEFRHAVRHTTRSLQALVTTWSHWLTAAPERQERMLADVAAVTVGLPEEFDLPYVTRAFRTVRR